MQGIDFAAIHLWPDNWLDATTDFVTAWLSLHDLDGKQTLNKPVLLNLSRVNWT